MKSAMGTLAEIIDCTLCVKLIWVLPWTMLYSPYHGENDSPIVSCRRLIFYTNLILNTLMMIRVRSWFRIPIRLFQRTFQIGVNDEWDTFLPVVVVETQPFAVLARYSDRAVIQFSTILAVDLQFSTRAKVAEASEKKYYIIYCILYIILYYYYCYYCYYCYCYCYCCCCCYVLIAKIFPVLVSENLRSHKTE